MEDSPFAILAEIVSFISNLQSIGEGIAGLFDPSTLDVEQIAQLVAQEVEAVFIRQFETEDIRTATSAVQSAIDYLNVKYDSAVGARASDDALYLLLSSGDGANYLSQLQTEMYTMAAWSGSSGTNNDLAQQTTSLYLLMAVTAISYYQEMSRRSNDSQGDSASVVKLAKEYYTQAQTLVDAVDKQRQAALSSLGLESQFNGTPPRGVTFSDTWVSTTITAYLRSAMFESGIGNDDPIGVGLALYENYQRLLATGSPALVQAITYQAVASGAYGAFGAGASIGTVAGTAAPYGLWLASCKASLANLLLLQTNPLGAPAPNPPNPLTIFGRGQDQAIYALVRDGSTDSGWGAWSRIGDGTFDMLAAAQNASGKYEVFARGTSDQQLYHNYQTGSGWSGWSSLGGNIGAQLTAIVNGTGSLEVFALDGSGALAHTWQDANSASGWSGWNSLGGNSVAFAVGRNDDGHLEAFAIGTDHALNHIWQDPGAVSGWDAWASLGGWSDLVTVSENAFSGLEVVARGSDKAVWHMWQDDGQPGGWTGWNSLGSLVDQLDVTFGGDGRLEIFARNNGTLQHLWQVGQNANGWGSWTELNSGAVDEFAVALNSNGMLEAFVRTSDGAVHHAWQDASMYSGWTGWSHIGAGGWVDLLTVPRMPRPLSPSGGASSYRNGAFAALQARIVGGSGGSSDQRPPD